jgi:hypothetical protein
MVRTVWLYVLVWLFTILLHVTLMVTRRLFGSVAGVVPFGFATVLATV